MTADLLFSPTRRRESVYVCVCVYTEAAQSISAYPFLSPLLFCSHCPDAPVSFSLFSSICLASPTLAAHLLVSISSHGLTYFFFVFSSTPFISSRPIHPIVAGLQLLFLLVCTLSHLQYNPATPSHYLSLTLSFFFSLKRSFGFQSSLFAISLISTRWIFFFFFYERIWNKMCF